MKTEGRAPDEWRKDVAGWARTRAAPVAARAREWRSPPGFRSPRRLMLAGALVVAVAGFILATRPAATLRPTHPAPGTTVFPIANNQVVLRFVHSTGSVNVSSGPAGQVSIKENRSGITNAINTSYRQRGNVITVTVSVENGLMEATWVDFSVAVPRDTSANVATAAGTLRATGLAGNLVLQDTNGSIWATNVTGALGLRTDSGSVNTSRVNGQVSAVTDNGTITTASTRLRGATLMQAQNGTINFHGSLDPGCHAIFRNTNGATGVTLPGGSSVLVDARARSGSINSEFSSVPVGTASGGRVANGRVGRDASARLSIQTMSGSINLNRGN